jgi:hypothetical protein
MKNRVEGKGRLTRRYAGMFLMPRDTFYLWSKNHPDFLRLHKIWCSNGYNKKLSPSINRINSNIGYKISNCEWVSHSQNSALSSVTRKNNKQKIAVYELVGVHNEA